jgi:hypothetical protein
MTIEEALLKIRETQRCWVVWNQWTGEILSVSEVSPQADGKEVFSSHVARLGQYGCPVKARELDSAKVTRQSLEEERAETERVKTRGLILTSWAAASSEELLRILESGEYSYPMNRDYDSGIIVDHLWELHRDELTQHVQQRLRSLIGSSVLSEEASRNLEAYLFALAGDEQELLDLWDSRRTASLARIFVLMQCFAHTNKCNQAVIDYLIDMVEEDAPFGIRYDAMMMLGRLDAARGTRAADVIRASIYDSSPWVVAARNHVLARLETDASQWMRCKECCHGLVHDPRSCCGVSCPHCFGLGFVQAQ